MQHLGKGPDNYIGNYDNVLLLGDLNLESSEIYLNDFCDISNLRSLVNQKIIHYRSYKNFENNNFCQDLKKIMIEVSLQQMLNYQNLMTLLFVLDKQA